MYSNGNGPYLNFMRIAEAKKICFYQTRPEGCTEEKWWQIYEDLGVWKSSTVYAAPPKYLSIEGHQDCLGVHESGSYKSYCLPTQQPDYCSEEAWAALQVKRLGPKVVP